MDKQLKYSIILGIFLLMVAIYWFVYNYFHYVQSLMPTRTFSVSGEGKVTAIPNIFIFNTGVISEGVDLANLQKENSEKMNKIINYFKKEGVESKDIETIKYSLTPRYDLSGKNIIGYRLEQSIAVKVRNLEKVGEILKGAVENGANFVDNLNFTFDEETRLKLENEAREKAIKQAKEKALAISKSAGFRLGRLVAINEYSSPYPVSIFKERSLGIGGDFSAPQIEPGTQEIIISVNLLYEIK